jgi:hypothetical protein
MKRLPSKRFDATCPSCQARFSQLLHDKLRVLLRHAEDGEDGGQGDASKRANLLGPRTFPTISFDALQV